MPGVPIGRGRHLVPRTAPARRLVLTLGALSPAELFDQNAYANDPRSQFTHGAFVNDATWDFPQDAHGFSRGGLASYITPRVADVWGLGLNAELGNADRSSGLFLRLGWKNGATEALASGEADWSASLGAQGSGSRWGRRDDAIGLALAWSALSRPHARYLEAGGFDPHLGPTGGRSAPERVLEGYYALAAAPWTTVSAGAQVIVTPGADGSRAPVTLLWLRVHLER